MTTRKKKLTARGADPDGVLINRKDIDILLSYFSDLSTAMGKVEVVLEGLEFHVEGMLGDLDEVKRTLKP